MREKPKKFSDFEVEYDTKGVNLMNLGKKINFKVSLDKLLAMLHFNKSSYRFIDEKIEPRIMKIIKRNKINRVVNYKKDYDMFFKFFNNFSGKSKSIVFFRKHKNIITKSMLFFKELFTGKAPYPDPRNWLIFLTGNNLNSVQFFCSHRLILLL